LEDKTECKAERYLPYQPSSVKVERYIKMVEKSLLYPMRRLVRVLSHSVGKGEGEFSILCAAPRSHNNDL